MPCDAADELAETVAGNRLRLPKPPRDRHSDEDEADDGPVKARRVAEGRDVVGGSRGEHKSERERRAGTERFWGVDAQIGYT